MTRTKALLLDMDGVVADFNSKCFEWIGCTLDDFANSQEAWAALGDRKLDMYIKLDPMQDAHKLVYACISLASLYKLEIGVLTAVPKYGRVPMAKQHKKEWITKYFPELLSNFNIGPWAEDKYKHCQYGDILIDDQKRNIDQWNAAGGFGILHTSAENTIKELIAYLAHTSALL